MPVDRVRVGEQARNQLITLKRRTGIMQWNVLCRIALCRSLAEPTLPPPAEPSTSAVEMDWGTFAGPYGEVLWGMLRWRCHRDGLGVDHETLAVQLRAHLHRGIGYLVADEAVRSIAGLAGWLAGERRAGVPGAR